MHIVTGAAGFVGSNIILALNERGVREILAVDDLTCGDKFRNLRGCDIADYMDKTEFRDFIRRGAPGLEATSVLHQGACADTTESDGRYMLDNNFTYSKELLHWAADRRVPLVYASSASVYGSARHCAETPECEGPLNVYAYSKWLFDDYVRRQMTGMGSTVVGLRPDPDEQEVGPGLRGPAQDHDRREQRAVSEPSTAPPLATHGNPSDLRTTRFAARG